MNPHAADGHHGYSDLLIMTADGGSTSAGWNL
jgi:hypothetical protein